MFLLFIRLFCFVVQTEAVKPVMGAYYREPEKSKSWFPFHLVQPLIKSFSEDHYVADEGDVLFYQQDSNFSGKE